MNNSFIALIKDIKRDDSLKNVERNYQICINNLKDLEKKKQNDKIFPFNNVIKEKSYILLKLLYLQMFGKKIDKEHNFSVIEILTCNKYILKRRAFLFLNNINDNEDVIFLLINLYKKELYKENISNTLGTKTRVLNSLTNISTSIIKDNLIMLANTYNNYGNNGINSNIGPRNSTSTVKSGSNFVSKENDLSHFQFSNNIEKYYKIINTTLILNSISNICTDIMSNNLYNDIFMLLNSSFMYVRKKSIISFYRLVICNLDILHIFFDFIKKNFILLYNNECPSYDTLHNEEPGYVLKNNTSLCCLIINIIAEIFCTLEKHEKKNTHQNINDNINTESEIIYQFDKKEKKYSSKFVQSNSIGEHTHNDKTQQSNPMYLKKYLSFIPFIYNILNDRLHLIDNWRLIKIIKFINKLTKYENRIYKKFLSIIIHIFYTNKAQSVVYECFEFILFNYKNTYNLEINLDKYISGNEKNLNKQENNAQMNQNIMNRHENNEERYKQIESLNKNENINKENGNVQNESDTLLCYCFSHLIKYLYSDDKNIVYVCTKLYRSIFAISDLYNIFVKYNLMHDFSRHIFNNFEHKDITLRNNLLYIIYFLINKNNFENIIYNILAYIYKNNDQEYLDEYINVILKYGENNLKHLNNINLYIFILFYILCLKNHGTNIKILDQIHKINSQFSSTHISTNFLSSLFIITYGNFLISTILIRKEIGNNNCLPIDSIENNTKHNLSTLINEKNDIQENLENNEMDVDNPTLNDNPIYNCNDSTRAVKENDKKKLSINTRIYNFNETVENEVDYFFNNHNESLEKYDLFEYIISILKIEDKISYSKENTSKYININNMNIKCFDYLIYFISIYIQETYKEIKEFKSDNFLNIFFFSLYLFFIKFSTSSILWNVTKIFVFFSQYNKFSDLSFFYLSKLEKYIDYLIFKQNDMQNLDRSLILKHILALINSKQSTNTSIFYNYFDTKIEIENIETSFNYSIPFKYNDSFFLQTNNQNSDNTSNFQYVDKYHKTSKSQTFNDELDILLYKTKRCSNILKENNLLFLVHINNHFKLYYYITQDHILYLYIDCIKDETNINNIVLSLSANIIEYKTNIEKQEQFKLVNNQENYFFKFNQNYLNEQIQNIDDTQLEDNTNNQNINTNKKITKNEIKISDNIIDCLTMSIKFSTHFNYIKLMLSYSYNMESYETSSITIPYFPMTPFVLSLDEFKKVICEHTYVYTILHMHTYM